jgi:apolipoprotein N-acyltransferase
VDRTTTRAEVLFAVVVSAAAFFVSLNHGSTWPLAWLAPVPVLFVNFGSVTARTGFVAAWAAYALGATNLLLAYAGTMPWPSLLLGVIGPALYFAASARAARYVAQRLGGSAGVLAFAAIWAGCDFLVSLGGDGTAPSPAYSQAGAPAIVQGASLFGIWIVTFLLGLFSAGLAMSLQRRRLMPAALAVVFLAADVAFGEWRLSHAEHPAHIRVGLGADDSIALRTTLSASQQLTVAKRYADAARMLARNGAALVVFPEKVSFLGVQARAPVLTILRTAAHASRTSIVIGFDDRSAEPRNEAVVFPADGSEPQFYFKRHMVAGLESSYVPGDGPLQFADRTSTEICKDMDFPGMVRRDVGQTNAAVLAVPAWDFDGDRWWHARLAIMRSIENNVSLARSAKQGLLTLVDAEGRVIAQRRSEQSGMVTLVGDLALGTGETLYRRIGDVFAWMCIAISLLLIAGAALRGANAARASTVSD